jgi:hypothetical protein
VRHNLNVHRTSVNKHILKCCVSTVYSHLVRVYTMGWLHLLFRIYHPLPDPLNNFIPLPYFRHHDLSNDFIDYFVKFMFINFNYLSAEYYFTCVYLNSVHAR